MDINKIKAIVFDLGNVIVDLDVSASIQALTALSARNDIIINLDSEPFINYEKGLITSADYRDKLRSYLQTEASDQQLDQAWNAMLVDTPVRRLNFMQSLREKYGVFVLSNTNEIHVDCFEQQIAKNANGRSLKDFTDKIYYSHVMQMRKPDEIIYQSMVDDIGIEASEILFFDDKKENVTAAQQVGLQSVQITHPDMVLTIL